MALAYLDTHSGIAGDMTLAALVDAGASVDYLRRQIDSLGLPGVELVFHETQRHCFRALMLEIKHPAEHVHRHLSDIEAMIDRSSLTVRERDMSRRLFRKLGAAEARVHGTTLDQVHFHEVGAVDSIVDICGIAIAICNLGITRLVASATPTGTGRIQIAHGSVSLPAPATAELLRGVPIRSSPIQAELTTPTGAAVLATLVDGFGHLPDMQISSIGYGAGHKDLAEQANLLRILIGVPLADDSDDVVVLEANLDDITGEQIGFAIERLWKTGAQDVFTTAIGMKKNRPATQLSVICQPEMRSRLEDCLFEHTGTLGVRRFHTARRKLHREVIRVSTPLGEVRLKVAWPQEAGARTPRFSPEFQDCRRIAEQQGQTLESVFRAALQAAEKQLSDLTPPENLSQRAAESADSAKLSSGSPAHGYATNHGHEHDHDNAHDHHHH